MVYAEPADACGNLTNPDAVRGKLVLINRGTCTFSTKVGWCTFKLRLSHGLKGGVWFQISG